MWSHLIPACIEYFGDTDRAELTAYHEFFDNYLNTVRKSSPNNERFDNLEKEVVECINSSDKKDEYYDKVRTAILGCLDTLRAGDECNAYLEYMYTVILYSHIFNCLTKSR